MRQLLNLIIICLIFGACHRNTVVDSTLSKADTLIFSAPDSAVTILNSLSTDDMSGFQCARHALLLTKAREKAGINIADTPYDSLLSSSIAALSESARRFQNRGDSLEAQTLFYLGVLLGYRGDYSDALISLMESADRSKTLGDHFYLAMSYREQADIYYRLLAHKKRIKLAKLAAHYFELADRPLHSVWEKVGIAYSFAISLDTDSALNQLKSIENEVIHQNNTYLTADWLRAYALASYQSADFRSSINHLNVLPSLGVNLDANDHYIMGMAYRAIHNLDSAIINLEWMSEMSYYKSDSLSMVRLKSLIESDLGNLSQALILNEAFIKQKSSITDNIITNPYISVLENYYSNLTESRTHRLNAHKTFLSTWIAFLSFILFTVIYLSYRRNKQCKLNIDRLNRNYHVLEVQRDNLYQCYSTNNIALSMLSQWLDSYRHICEEAYLLPTSVRLNNNSKKQTLRSLSNPDTISLIELIANSSKDNIMQRFRNLVPNLTDKQYTLSLLLFLDFSPEAMCTVLNIERKKYSCGFKTPSQKYPSFLQQRQSSSFFPIFLTYFIPYYKP